MLWNVARSRCLSCAALLVWPHWPGNIFSTSSTPAREVHGLSIFVLIITGGIFVGVASLLVFALVRFRHRTGDMTEPPQVFGSMQIELAWTIIPILLIIVLFLGTARVIFAVQDAPKPASALDVTVVGHQFWWEFRYPKYNVVIANELHVPLSDPQSPTPTFLKLTSADVMHSFWIPRLAGKTDLLPNRVNEMWVDPHEPGLFLGQCAQFCGTQHAKMLLRVYVDSPQDFQRWIAQQQQAQQSGTPDPGDVAANRPESSDAITPEQGRRVFEEQACMNCHTISGTAANGRFGPDLTHLMSRATIAAGIVPNTPENLKIWITTPDELKPGSLMPAMHLNDLQNAQLVAYLTTLR
ncbi:MAG: cytochrome c oxidase subunit II [Acidobacteriales bacterium]|nr:cytochrome c oxidase subunit II [Terriglobales bacterium]